MINPKRLEQEIDQIIVGQRDSYSDHQRSEILTKLPEWINGLNQFVSQSRSTMSNDEIRATKKDVTGFFLKVMPVLNNVKDIRSIAKLIEIAMFYRYNQNKFW